MVFFKIKYPKITLFILLIILTYFIFRIPSISQFVSSLSFGSSGYLGIFIAGILFSFGFSAPLAVGFFLVLNPTNLWLAAIVGGLGSLVSDLSIFEIDKLSFDDEFKKIHKSKFSKKISFLIKKLFGKKAHTYIAYFVACFFIASPLPDEFGVTIIEGITKIDVKIFTLISFVLHVLGILIILGI
jgi:hypothetical protein